MRDRWRPALLLTATMLGAATPPAAGSDDPFVDHHVTDRLGRTVTYHLSIAPSPAPILLMIQGSGCSAVLQRRDGAVSSTVFGLLPLAAQRRFTLLAVEKPFASPDARGGTAEGCDVAYNASFTADSWLAALTAALDDVRRLPGMAHRRLVLFGMSEGATMASLLAGRDRAVTDVIVTGGSGTTQAFDLLADAYQRCFDRTACLAAAEGQLRAIAASPDSATRFAWGHPFKRWSSFFRVDPGAELARSHARVYLIIGTADQNTPALSQEIIAARLIATGRDVTVRRVADADHSLMRRGDTDLSGLQAEMARALQWIDAPPAPVR